MTKTATDWWAELYDDLLADVLLERHDAADVERTLDFLTEVLELAPGARVFDQCCGTGSLAIPLAERGYRVVGVDQASGYIERASARAAEAGVDAQLSAADACRFTADAPCDAAFNWWTSFGYSADDSANAEMLARAFESLRPGAHFALDTMNLPGVLRGFRPDWITRRETERGEVVLLRETRLDLPAGMMHKTWTYLVPGSGGSERIERHSSVRLYMPHTLSDMLQSVGFEGVRFFGNTSGEELDIDSPRCIAVASKPAR